MSSYHSSKRSSLTSNGSYSRNTALSTLHQQHSQHGSPDQSFRRSTSSFMSDYANDNSRSASPELSKSMNGIPYSSANASYGNASSATGLQTCPKSGLPIARHDSLLARQRSSSLQSLPEDEGDQSLQIEADQDGPRTPTRARSWSEDSGIVVHSSSDDMLNGFRVSIDPSSRRDTMVSMAGAYAGYSAPVESPTPFSPIPTALTAGHLPPGAAMPSDTDRTRTFSMLYGSSTVEDGSETSSLAKRRKPLALPGQASPATPKTPGMGRNANMMATGPLSSGGNTYSPSPLFASSSRMASLDSYSGHDSDYQPIVLETTKPSPVPTSTSSNYIPALSFDLDFGSDSLFGNSTSLDLASTLFDFSASSRSSQNEDQDPSQLSLHSSDSHTPRERSQNNDTLAFPPSRKSSVRTVTKSEFSQANSPQAQQTQFQPSAIELPPSRPLSSMYGAIKRNVGSAFSSRAHSRNTSIGSQLSASEINNALAAQQSTSGVASAHSSRSHISSADFKPTQPLFSNGRSRSSTADSRNRSDSVASSTHRQQQEIGSGFSSHTQSSERLGSIDNMGELGVGAKSPQINKSLPPTPGMKQRLLAPLTSRPSFPERSASIRKTSAQASAAASNLLSKGKNLMSRSHGASESSAGISSLDYDQYHSQGYTRKPNLSRASISSLFGKHQADKSSLSAYDTSFRTSEDRQGSVLPTSSEGEERGSSLLTSERIVQQFKSPQSIIPGDKIDMSRNPNGRTSMSDGEQPSLYIPLEHPAAPKATARKPSEVKRERSNSEKRPSTDQLLAMASLKLAKFAAERESATPSTGSGRSHTSSPTSPASTDASSHTHQTIEPEQFSVAQAIRIKRPDNNSSDGATTTATIVPTKSSHSDTTVAHEESSDVDRVALPVVQAVPKFMHKQHSADPITKALSKPQLTLSEAPTLDRRSSSINDIDSRESKAVSATSLKSPLLKTPKAPIPVWQKRISTFLPSESLVEPSSWASLESALQEYSKALQYRLPNRQEIAQASLLSFLKRAEMGQEKISADHERASQQHEILFGWLNVLSDDLKGVPANRGTCLDGVAAILESQLLSSDKLADQASSDTFRNELISMLEFAVEKLNEKAVYANTLSFSGRLFAVAFFRIEGVGLKLLRLLPVVKRQDLKRILAEVNIPPFPVPPMRTDIFPAHLHSLCFTDITSYSQMFSPLAPSETSFLVQSAHNAVRMHGNWLIRWQASDSDLPFAFYRAYHRQLAAYLRPPTRENGAEAFLPAYEAISAPGFLFLSASLLEKIDSLIHRNLRSVTTLAPGNGSFNSQDSANMSMGAKPKVLEHANRRVVSTILDVVGGPARPVSDPDYDNFEGFARRRYFGGMLQVWLRAVVKRTSLFDARGVFLLLDFIEGLFYTVCTPITLPGQQESGIWHPSIESLPMFDIRFILSFIRTIFEKADNTICLMRTVTFLYSQFESFTSRVEDKVDLCQRILLHPDIFQRMFLYWNASVRGYYLRLIVWRLSRLGISADGRLMEQRDAQTVSILQTLNSRLEGVRKRHDEIDPLDDLPDDDLFDSSRASVDSTRGVNNQPWIVEELLEGTSKRNSVLSNYEEGNWHEDHTAAQNEPSDDDFSYFEKLKTTNSRNGKDNVAVSKMVNWLKVLKGKKNGKSKLVDSHIQPFDLHSPTTFKTPTDSAVDITITKSPNPERSDSPRARTVSIDASRLSLHINPDDVQQVQTNLIEADEQDPKEPFPYMSNAPAATDNTFFQFEFESSGVVAPESFEGKRSRRASVKTVERQSLHNGTVTPRRAGSVSASPRVSKRFSKRASILPPPALDLLMESSEPVPQIPKEFQEPPPYDRHNHCYAIRGLREYEDALDEYDVWLARLEENDEDLEGREQGELVPKLTVLWPLSFSED